MQAKDYLKLKSPFPLLENNSFLVSVNNKTYAMLMKKQLGIGFLCYIVSL